MGCLAFDLGDFEFASCAANDNFTFNGLNQIATQNGTAFSYDARGNLAFDGVKSYIYNAENMLTSATQAGVTSTLTYDAQNRLASITKNGVTTKFIYDGTDLIAEYDGNNNLLRKYVHGAGIDESLVWFEGTGTSDKRFIISDHQGSVIATTNAAGSILNISTYSPYGERTNTNAAYASRFGYTGQADLPEINLQYYKARIYDPKLGRFLQSDPIGYEAGMNIYAYVLGDPINGMDPLGLQVEATITAPRLTDDQKCERQYGAGNCYSGGGEYTLPFWVREERPSDFDGVPDFIIPQYGKGGGGGSGSTQCSKGTPKPTPNFLPPTNPAQLPPSPPPEGFKVHEMPPTEQYPNGYWKMTNAKGQPVDPSTLKPPGNVTKFQSRSMTHFSFPDPVAAGSQSGVNSKVIGILSAISKPTAIGILCSTLKPKPAY